ncbi:MAG: ubiquinone biosynthesis protein COQ9 [Alphaproteobacteria bacterium]|jgi:ubiquinone biosynthesis protein COQ9
MLKIIGNIEHDHPYFIKLQLFFDALLDELPFHNHINAAIDVIINNHVITDNEYQIMFPDHIKDVANSLVDYLNLQTIEFFEKSDLKGVKAILKSLIMFQIRLKPNMIDNFKKIINYNILKENPLHKAYRFYALIDTLWYLAGDQATDYNYYSKRFLLGNIYLETIVYAQSDSSDHYKDTEDFLIRSFDKIATIEKLKKKLPNLTHIEENITALIGKLRYK